MAHDLEQVCRALAGVSTSWSWDGRFAAVVAAFDAAHEDATRTAIAAHLDQRFGATEVATAPARVRGIVGKLGGMRGEQSLYAREIAGALVWCAWWPWQSGTRFSLRVGVDGPAPIDLRAWFGV